MNLDLRRTAQAEEDLINIWLYIAREDPNAANRLLKRLDARSRDLCIHPDLGPARDDIAAGFRHLVSENYIILYRKGDSYVEIVRYLHGAQNLSSL